MYFIIQILSLFALYHLLNIFWKIKKKTNKIRKIFAKCWVFLIVMSLSYRKHKKTHNKTVSLFSPTLSGPGSIFVGFTIVGWPPGGKRGSFLFINLCVQHLLDFLECEKIESRKNIHGMKKESIETKNGVYRNIFF